ncbi:uncharacterized protein [Amphiura filiformis]|uniref:uncharacterized protein n=1 Tax=Amphiura filiformis TaxID=82378 RepID=UPI003B2144F0
MSTRSVFGLTSTECPTNWSYYNQHCYILRDDTMVRQEAREACLQMDADLVVIDDGEENEFVTTLLPRFARTAYWIGLGSSTNMPDEYIWVDGTVARNADENNIAFTNWQPREPSSSNENCVLITTEGYWVQYSRGGWNDEDCEMGFGYICERMTLQNDVTTHYAIHDTITWSTDDFSTESRTTIIRSGQTSGNLQIIIPVCVVGGALLIGITMLCYYIRKRSSTASTAGYNPQATYTGSTLQSSNTNSRQTAGNPSTRTNTDSSGYQIPKRTDGSDVVYENQSAPSYDNLMMPELNRGSALSNVYENPDRL